jgi:hypothetical protein
MGRKTFMDIQLAIRTLGLRHNRQNRVNEGFIPVVVELPIYPVTPCTENTFSHHEFELTDLLILHSGHFSISLYPIVVSKLPSKPKDFLPRVCMSDELSAAEKVVEEFMIDLMNERVMSMSTGVQASSMRGLPTSPSTSHRAGPSRPSDEKWTKHRYDLAYAKLIPSILPAYIPPLSGRVN